MHELHNGSCSAAAFIKHCSNMATAPLQSFLTFVPKLQLQVAGKHQYSIGAGIVCPGWASRAPPEPAPAHFQHRDTNNAGALVPAAVAEPWTCNTTLTAALSLCTHNSQDHARASGGGADSNAVLRVRKASYGPNVSCHPVTGAWPLKSGGSRLWERAVGHAGARLCQRLPSTSCLLPGFRNTRLDETGRLPCTDSSYNSPLHIVSGHG